MSYDPHDTIAAIASADGGAARGIVRISGPQKGVRTLFRSAHKGDEPHFEGKWGLSPFSCAGSVEVSLDGATRTLPCDLFLWPTNRSYTRETVAELHTFGSPPLLRAVLEAVCRAGARLAEPGEFTLRAFLAGRLDLTQAEAVLGVIDAHGADELHTAVEQLAGNLARPLHRLRDDLVMLLAELEAGLDFVEEDIEFISADELTARLQAITAELAAVAEQMASRLTANAARRIVLLGPPNAGKSSLFNALVQRFGVAAHTPASAIVSEIRGTTRDYLAATVEFAGHRCELIDTAGIDTVADATSSIAASAQNQSSQQSRHSLIRILCVDATNSHTSSAAIDASLYDAVVLTKSDIAAAISPSIASPESTRVIATSSVTGAGLEELATVVAAMLSTTSAASRTSCVAATADRCRDSVRLADASVARAADIAATRSGDELVAAEIRVALAELGKVIGAIYTDDLLDRIFKTFCIGK